MPLVITNRHRFLLVSLILLALAVSAASALWFQEKADREKEMAAAQAVEEKAPNPFADLKSPHRFSYIGPELKVPAEAFFYELKNEPLSEEQRQKISSTFGFTNLTPIEIEDKVDGRILLWDGPQATLYLRLRQKVIKYSLKQLKLTDKLAAISLEQAQAVAREFLESRNLFQNLDFREEYEYIRGLEVDPRPAGVSQAEGIRLGLTYTVGDWPILDDFLGPEPVSLVVRNDGQVISLSYLMLLTSDLTKSQSLPLKTLAQAKEDLTRGEGLGVGVLTSESENANPQPYSTLLRKVYLAYFRSLKTQRLQPVFVFEGPAARVLVPAFKGQ